MTQIRTCIKKWLKVFTIGLLPIIIFSCKREKVDVIGPELAIASPSFAFDSPFQASADIINFGIEPLYFEATFNERVSWTISITGLNTNAKKIIKGTSSSISDLNSKWTGGHRGLYFFETGEKAVAELSIFGVLETWKDTVIITGEKFDYGKNVLVWWDMETSGIAANGVASCYWFDFFDETPSEKIVGFLDNVYSNNDPIQGGYRSIEGKDGIGPTDFFIGAVSHSPRNPGAGFADTSLDDIYLNFYLRRRTNTSSASVELTSDVSGTPSRLYYNVGEITWTGWQLVSAKLSDMDTGDGDPPFDASNITQFLLALQVVTGPGVDQTGVDIDFITITKGGAFNPDKN